MSLPCMLRRVSDLPINSYIHVTFFNLGKFFSILKSDNFVIMDFCGFIKDTSFVVIENWLNIYILTSGSPNSALFVFSFQHFAFFVCRTEKKP